MGWPSPHALTLDSTADFNRQANARRCAEQKYSIKWRSLFLYLQYLELLCARKEPTGLAESSQVDLSLQTSTHLGLASHLHAFPGLRKTSGCLSKQPQTQQSLRYRGSESKLERVPSKHKPSTSHLVSSPIHLPFPIVHHPLSVFRDQLYKYLETVPQGDFDTFTAKLVQAGGTLELLKYADALFETILIGRLLQPGGSFVEDNAPISPFGIHNAQYPADVDEIKKYVDVLNKLIRR